MINWNKITGFNFTYALAGGAWLRDADGNTNWFTYATIQAHMGEGWYDAQLKRQGQMTGCWITVP